MNEKLNELDKRTVTRIKRMEVIKKNSHRTKSHVSVFLKRGGNMQLHVSVMFTSYGNVKIKVYVFPSR